jgi:RNA polymerase sigma-70 factor (ECF subfamily)
MLPANTAVELGQNLTDDDLLARILAGDLRYFETLMRRHNQRVFRAARSVVADAAEAEDVMQAAYVRAFLGLERFEGRASFATWITRIAIHEAVARVRRGKRRSASMIEIGAREAPVPSPEQSAATGELRAILTAAIDKLPDPLRRAFVLREVEQMSSAETAAVLGITEDAVKVRVHRARAALRDTISTSFDGEVQSLFGFHLERCDRVVGGTLVRLHARSTGLVQALVQA